MTDKQKIRRPSKLKSPAKAKRAYKASIVGRPQMYTQELGMAICNAIGEGVSLSRISKLDGMPAMSTVFMWLDKYPEFMDIYAKAKAVQAERMAEEIIDLSDDKSGDVSGELAIPNSVAVQRARLQVDARKWVAAKLLPKKYGEKVQQEVTGKDGAPIEHAITINFVRTGITGGENS